MRIEQVNRLIKIQSKLGVKWICCDSYLPIDYAINFINYTYFLIILVHPSYSKSFVSDYGGEV